MWTRISRRTEDSSFCRISKTFLWDIWVKIALILIDSKFILDLLLPSRHLLVPSIQWKHQNNAWNLLKLSIKIPKRHHWRRSGVYDIIDVTLGFPLLNLNRFQTLFCWFYWVTHHLNRMYVQQYTFLSTKKELVKRYTIEKVFKYVPS